jgi:hypothetical protein
MHQLGLFDPRETVLVDDDRGRIEYVPRFVPAAVAQAWFASDLRRGEVGGRAPLDVRP